MEVHLKRLALSLALVPLACVCTAQQPSSPPAAQPPMPLWVASWATSVQGPEASQPPVETAKLTDATVRQIVHLSVGGNELRVVFSNAFGVEPLVIDAARVDLAEAPNSSRILASHGAALSFSGRSSVVIPVGASFLSDPVTLNVAPLSNLAITFHLPFAPSVQSAHPGSRATSYLLPGNHVADADLPGAEKVVRWMQIAEVDVVGQATGALVAFGDSITDGHGATTDGNDRWPDVLAARLQASAMKSVAVVNEGIGGNHLLTNGLGQSALERLDRDLLAVSNVRAMLILEGINDLGGLARKPDATPADHTVLVQRLEAAFSQVIERAHAHSIRVYGATITPDGGSGYYHPSTDDEAARTAVNAWIRQPGHFDGVVDFDAVVRDPAQPDRLLPAFDSGDHLHPGPAGYKAMGDAIPLGLFH